MPNKIFQDIYNDLSIKIDFDHQDDNEMQKIYHKIKALTKTDLRSVKKCSRVKVKSSIILPAKLIFQVKPYAKFQIKSDI